MTTRRHRTAAVALAATLLLAACSDDAEPGDGPEPSPVETTDAPEAPEEAPDDEDGGDGPATGEDAEAPEDGDGTDPTDGSGGTDATDEQPPGDGGRIVEVLVTYAGPGDSSDVLEVVAYVPDVIEEGGTCTATLRGTDTAVTVPAWLDASSTSCSLMELPVAPAAGQEVVVDYRSDESVGVSHPAAVTP